MKLNEQLKVVLPTTTEYPKSNKACYVLEHRNFIKKKKKNY